MFHVSSIVNGSTCIIKILLKVCHSSAFQTISIRSVYIKIINYSGSIFANLKNKMQKKVFNEKNTLIFKYKQDLTRDYILWWKDLEQKMCKIFSFINSISWNCIQYIWISIGVVFLRRQEYFIWDSNDNLKQFLYFLTINFRKSLLFVCKYFFCEVCGSPWSFVVHLLNVL